MSYRAAPLDRLARVVTRLTWALAGGFLAVGAWLAAGADNAGWILLAVGALLAAMMAYLWRLQPLEYVVEVGAFAVNRRSAAPRRFTGAPTGAREGALGLRVAGDGGAYGYLGRFRADGRTVHAYVTDRSKVALVDVGGTTLAVSPSDRDAFLAEVGSGA
jgi:hypothetical protein